MFRWWGLSVIVLVVGGVGAVTAKKPRPVPCQPGRFLVAPTDAPLLGTGSSDVDLIDWTGAGAISTAECAATAVRVRTRRTFTRLKARWKSCGSVRRVRLKARIGSPSCTTMTGTVRAKGVPPRAFVATRTTVTTSTTLTPVSSSTTTTTAIPCDICAAACNPTPGGTNGTTAGRRNDYGFGGGACPEIYDGPDAVYRVAVPGGATLTATATPTPFFDVALAMVLDCADIALSCTGQANRELEGGAEILSYTNPSSTPRDVFIIVDGVSGFIAGNFLLDVQVAAGPP
jgi:hypothetical protein